MGNCTSNNGSDPVARAHSDVIDHEIEVHSRTFRKECKILLLGQSSCHRSVKESSNS